MRKHQPIWIQLKAIKTVSVAAEPKLHARIIKAVIKEKHRDLGWSYIQLEAGMKWKLVSKVEGKLVTFKLVDVSHLIAININNL
jgi:hypothetical protein